MEQWLAVSDPVTSSFGQGPWPSFNNTMMVVDHLQVPRTQRTVQRLEQSLLERITTPPILSSSSEEGETGTQAPPSPILHPATPLEIWMTHHHLWHPLLSTAAQHPRKGPSLCHPLIGLAMEDVPSSVSATPLWW